MATKYFKNIKGGYITSISTNQGSVEIKKVEYDNISNVILNCPDAPEGYRYLLKEDLTWELHEEPVYPDADIATIEDYEDALSRLGVEK